MTKSLNNNAVGDTHAPALSQNEESLRCSVDQATEISADKSQRAVPINAMSNLSLALKVRSETEPPLGSCVQTLWFSFFFDGTGNNQDADEGTLKHSNVSRLFRAMPMNNVIEGRYAFYVPGVGTYFKEVGDAGGSIAGGAGGDMGTERLEWAVSQFDEKMKAHIARANNPTNKIIEINISAFGFSRGAALARAFVHRVVLDRCKQDAELQWRLTPGGYPVRIRFLGLFDTVASVGLPMSSNNTNVSGVAIRSVRYMLNRRAHASDFASTQPERIAFSEGGKPGADPAPGVFNGHSRWGGDMAIPEMVEEVRHFVAAHEIRNSFPLDSVSVLVNGRIHKPAHFFETVYPGVHSDIGGSYRPGEGGKCDEPTDKLGLIPLMHMYTYALAKGVPLLPVLAWSELNKDDFNVSSHTVALFTHYQSKITCAATLGDLFNANMALYYAWRFRAIHRKASGDHREKDQITKNDIRLKSDEVSLKKEISALDEKNNVAAMKYQRASMQRDSYRDLNRGTERSVAGIIPYNDAVASARDDSKDAQDKLLRAKARMDALPKAGGLAEKLAMYDQQLMDDCKAIYDVYSGAAVHRSEQSGSLKNKLRPHYKLMMTAYENEFITGTGLTDPAIVEFFDNLVHDSLAGFAGDATLPSDPRAIYLGGNEKYKYALNRNEPTTRAA